MAGRTTVTDMIIKKLDEMHAEQKEQRGILMEVKEQTTKTNGRVNMLESKADAARTMAVSLEKRVDIIEEHAKIEEKTEERTWRSKEFIAKYGFQAAAWILSLIALIISIKAA